MQIKNITRLSIGLAVLTLVFAASQTDAATQASTTAQLRIQKQENSLQIRQNAKVNAQTIRASSTLATSSRAQALRDNRRAMALSLKENQEEFVKAIQSRTTDLINRLKSVAGNIRIKLEAQSQQRIISRLNNIFGNLKVRVARLSNADTKLSVRINEATSAGVNTATTTALYENAQTLLSKARTDVESAKNVALQEATSTASKADIHTLVKTAEDSIKAAAASYREVLRSLEAIYPSNKVGTINASSSATTTVR